MKRIVFHFFFILAFVTGLIPTSILAASNDAIVLPDPNFEAAIREEIGKPLGVITKGDVEKITSLNVSSSNIFNLQGIEHFTALENLWCNDNQLTMLDVSSNAALQYLGCHNNQLIKLDVSGSAVLRRLVCSDNQLITLDVSNNNALVSLYCSYNQLETLDVSKNTVLQELYCYDNLLISLDVSYNTVLRHLNCNTNQLTTLKVGKNEVMENLHCAQNKLSALDISMVLNLDFLYCSDNLLTTLDISKNTALEWLNCRNNYLPDISAIIGLDESRTSVSFDWQNIGLPPSPWALEYVNHAKTLGFIPIWSDWNYQLNITRAEYCTLAVTMYEKTTGVEITGRKTFIDNDDVNVEKAAFIGVIDGVGNNMFDPNETLSREQAATMLSRLAFVIGVPLPVQAVKFADNSSISSWALEPVGQVQAAGIMQGVGNDRFAPKEPYSKEQSIITIIRLYDYITSSEALLLQNLP